MPVRGVATATAPDGDAGGGGVVEWPREVAGAGRAFASAAFVRAQGRAEPRRVQRLGDADEEWLLGLLSEDDMLVGV